MYRIPIAWAGLFMGAAVFPPVVLDSLERGAVSNAGIVAAIVGSLSVVFGITVIVAGHRQQKAKRLPSGARLALVVNVLFLAFFSLEFSDLMVRQGGKLIYWTNFLFLPALVLFWGLLNVRHWAWWMSRALAALGVLWFVGVSFLIPFGNIQRDGVPASTEVRLYMIGVSLAFAGTLLLAFKAIGDPETRSHFGLTKNQ